MNAEQCRAYVVALNASFVGKCGHYQVKGLSFVVQVIDARTRYGTVDLLIEPVNGSGQQWVSEYSVNFES